MDHGIGPVACVCRRMNESYPTCMRGGTRSYRPRPSTDVLPLFTTGNQGDTGRASAQIGVGWTTGLTETPHRPLDVPNKEKKKRKRRREEKRE